MAYRIEKGDETVQGGVRRIAGEQIGRALKELDNGDLDVAEKVHRVRKRCKKLRGLLHLIGPVFDNFDAENKAYRNAARLLSGVRDRRILLRTYDALTSHLEDQVDLRTFAPIRIKLVEEAGRESADPQTEERMQAFRRNMEAALHRAKEWKLDKEGFDAIEPGVGKTYKRARNWMKKAWLTRDDETVHDWRRQVKYHWYHARLLRDTLPDDMGSRADAAEKLAELLGDHHDLVVLGSWLGTVAGEFREGPGFDALVALIHRRKGALATTAFELGRRSMAERWPRYWKVWTAGEAG
jgi:CHAD domain-containing protein